jgi:hypothetical protein
MRRGGSVCMGLVTGAMVSARTVGFDGYQDRVLAGTGTDGADVR